MARFTYTAEKHDGEIYKGVAEAHDRFEIYEVIRKEGARMVSVDEDMVTNNFLSLSYWNTKLSSVNEQEKVLFTRNIGSMLQAGLPLSRALTVIERQTRNQRLRSATSEIAGHIRHGITLHEALGKFPRIFPKIVVAMVRAGEEGGDLSSALMVVSDQMERSLELKKKVKSALMYPVIVLIAIFGIGALMMTTVVPTLAKTFKDTGAKLPASTQAIINLSDFLTNYTFLAIGLLVAFIGLCYGILRTDSGKRGRDFVLLHTPLIGELVREINAARTSRTLASLVASGVGVLPALEITGDVVQNYYFRIVIKDAVHSVTEGEPLSASFMRREDLYPIFVGEMMAVGEETGQTADMLKRLAIYYENEVDRKTKSLSTIIEPFMMLFIGSLVGFFAMAMITPIYQVSQNI